MDGTTECMDGTTGIDECMDGTTGIDECMDGTNEINEVKWTDRSGIDETRDQWISDTSLNREDLIPYAWMPLVWWAYFLSTDTSSVEISDD